MSIQRSNDDHNTDSVVRKTNAAERSFNLIQISRAE